MRGNRIAATLLEILVCPVCHGKLDPGASNEQDPQAAPQWLRCRGCGRRYPIEDGIPVMLESRAIGAC